MTTCPTVLSKMQSASANAYYCRVVTVPLNKVASTTKSIGANAQAAHKAFAASVGTCPLSV